MKERLTPKNADAYFDAISEALATPEFRPRALYERFRIEVLATTDSPLDSLDHHLALKQSGWQRARDSDVPPGRGGRSRLAAFATNVARLGELTGEDTSTWRGYLASAAQIARTFQSGRRDRDRSRPSERRDRRPDAIEATKLFDRC